VLKHRARLKEIYDSTQSDAEKRVAKVRVFEELRNDYAKLKSGWNGYAAFDNWFKQDLNNAHLAAIGLYSQCVSGFQKLLAQQDGNLTNFYRSVEEMANLPKTERDMVLRKLGEPEN
jgi:predicted aminopeptidase